MGRLHRTEGLVLGVALLLLTPNPELAAQLGSQRSPALSTAPYLSKLHPKIRALLEDHRSQGLSPQEGSADSADSTPPSIEVLAWTKAGTALPSGLSRVILRPYVNPSGLQAAYGIVDLQDLARLASSRHVLGVLPTKGAIEPPINPGGGLGGPGAWSGASAPEDGQTTKDWFEVDEVHRSRAAWAQGFTGQGVRVLINDSGIDFCHPDLQGTWATVEDAGSPYHGWPMMFDGYSMLMAFFDQSWGHTNIIDGATDYADTSATCSGSESCRYQPLGAEGEHVYTLPGTSRSGVYHIGSHPDRTLDRGHGRSAVLVADEGTAGVYDTVYVDLDQDHDFTNDTPARQESPAACGSYGTRTYSGGLVYFIADGNNPIPASDWMYNLAPPANGSLVAFAINDPSEAGGNHGQKCASAVAGQGVIDGGAPAFKPSTGEPGDGMVVGGGRDAKLVSVGNTFLVSDTISVFDLASLGYDGQPGTGDEVQIISNSWGRAWMANDGWDPISRQIDALQQTVAPSLSVLFSSGNGGPGYGTIAPPLPSGAIAVGASTQNGSTGRDVIAAAEQITYGDVIPFSNRGPSARGTVGVHVVAGGAFAAGDVTVNASSDNVQLAWDTWGGTSRATPIAAGNLALVYDAYRQAHGVWPDHATARALLMAGARNINHDPLSMGAGMVDAERSCRAAAGQLNETTGGLYVTPPALAAGDYRGTVYPAFANLCFAGRVHEHELTLHNTGSEIITASARAVRLTRSARDLRLDWQTSSVGLEDDYDLSTPHYLLELTPEIPPGTDLMVVRMVRPLAELDTNADYYHDNLITLLAYDWTDDGDGELWRDTDGNGTINAGELDPDDQYVRLTYNTAAGTSDEIRVQRPLERMNDGIWLGLQHSSNEHGNEITHLQLRVEYYGYEEWSWLEVPEGVQVGSGHSAALPVRVEVPEGTPPGVYEGSIQLDDGSHSSTVPVVVVVAAELGAHSLHLGGPDARQADLLYDNGVVRGLFDWTWRADAGDWRLFFIDVPDGQPDGSTLQVRTSWQDAPGLTDIDTLIFGPVDDVPASAGLQEHLGPYTLGLIGGSANHNVGAGVWLFQTSTGGPEDHVSAELRSGLHVIALHNVLYQGSSETFEVPFSIEVASLTPSPRRMLIDPVASVGSITYLAETPMSFDSLQVRAFGLSCPATVYSGHLQQGGTSHRAIEVHNAGRISVSVEGDPGDDLDLRLYDPSDNLVASSQGPGSSEGVVVRAPTDGAWRAEVSAVSASGPTAQYTMEAEVIQGNDIEITSAPSGPIAAGEPISIRLGYSIPESTSCQSLRGVLLFGPPGADPTEVLIELDVLLEDHTWLVPGVAHLLGAEHTRWRTSLAIVNPGPEPASTALAFRPYDPEQPSRHTRLSLAPRSTVEWADVLVSLLGYDSSTEIKGSLKIGSDQSLVISARTYNQAIAGTYGQLMPAVDSGRSLGEGDVAIIPQLAAGASGRTNIGVVNLGSQAAEVRLELLGEHGELLAAPMTSMVSPGRYLQWNDVLRSRALEADQSPADPAPAYARLSATAADASVWAFASVIDSVTGDPTTVPIVINPSSGRYLIPAVAHAPGALGTEWRTDVAVANPSQQQIAIDLTFVPQDGSEATIGGHLVVPEAGAIHWQDVLVDAFGLSELEECKGTMVIEADGPLAISARTYNKASSGTFGQHIPALSSAEALRAGETGVIPQLRNDQAFRSNLGVLNLGVEPCEVEITLHSAAGHQLGRSVMVDIDPARYWQADNIFGPSQTNAGGQATAYARVRVLTDSGQVWAYGSVVDNHTGDPTTIPLLVE